MKLADDEKAVLDGKEGPARQRAMDLLVRYGEALGAERLVDTNNVCATVGATTPFLRDWAAAHPGGMDAVFSEFSLDSAEVLEIPRVKAYTCHVQQGIDPEHAAEQGVSPQLVQLYRRGEAYMGRIGVQLLNTCAPYQVGNVPVKGEHCAWMESSAVIYCNGALGARTNAEGRESAGAAMLTGKIPYWGYHLDENRLGTHLVEIEVEVKDTADWGLLGYYIGEVVQERIPVLNGIQHVPNLARLKHFGAAAASSGGVEMYHIVGITPEAPSLGGRPSAAGKPIGDAEVRCGGEKARLREDQFDGRATPMSITSCSDARITRSSRSGKRASCSRASASARDCSCGSSPRAR